MVVQRGVVQLDAGVLVGCEVVKNKDVKRRAQCVGLLAPVIG